MASTDIRINIVRDDTNKIKKLVADQKAILSSFQKMIGQMQDNWAGGGYEAYVSLFNSVRPDSLSMLDRLAEMNGTIVSMVNQLEEVDRSEASNIQSIY